MLLRTSFGSSHKSFVPEIGVAGIGLEVCIVKVIESGEKMIAVVDVVWRYFSGCHKETTYI